jgi:hypothetical protein
MQEASTLTKKARVECVEDLDESEFSSASTTERNDGAIPVMEAGRSSPSTIDLAADISWLSS